MNILPKKSWHVRTKANIAKVRRDEAEAAEKEKEIERRAKLAEQESRVAVLRERAKLKRPLETSETAETDTNSKSSKADIFTDDGNINFFKDIEAGLRTGVSTKKEEEKREVEEFEKKAGILVQLGQSSVELSGGKHWYEDNSVSKSISSSGPEIGLKQKLVIDPMNDILKYGGGRTSSHVEPTANVIKSNQVSLKKKSKHKKKSKKHKKEDFSPKRHKKRRHSSPVGPSLSQLREERLEREAKERYRTERLLAGKDPDGVDEPTTKEVIKQKYNSQFNPVHARQNYGK